MWGERDQGAFHLWQLGDFPCAFACLRDADQGAFANLFGGRCFVRQARLRRFEAVASDGDLLAVLANHHHFARGGFEHHRRQHIAVVGVVLECVINGLFHFFGICRQVDEFFRSPINLAALKIHDALSQGLVGGHLLGRLHGGVNVQTPCVGFLAVLGKDHLPDGFGHVFGMQDFFVSRRAQLQGLCLGGFGLSCGDVLVVFHPLDDVELARAGTFGVADRVVGRGCFGQPCQHGGFGNADVLERFAEVGFSGRGKTVSPIAQENLVHVDLKDLVLGQHVLEFVGQQNFINFAGVGFLGRQVHVACHLHGDGRCALAFHSAQIGDARAQDAQVVHTAVLVKAVVFDGQNRVFHHLRYFLDGRQVAALFAEFAHQLAIFRENTQGQFGLVVFQVGNIGQVRVGDHHGHTHHHEDGKQPGGHEARSPQGQLHNPRQEGGGRVMPFKALLF